MSNVLARVGLAATLAALPSASLAGGMAVVDFQQALVEVNEGKIVQARLEGMYTEKKKSIDEMEKRLMAMQQEYEQQALVMTPDALKAKEREIMQGQMVYQQEVQKAEMDFQAQYNREMETLLGKMAEICEQMGKEKGYDMVIERNAGVVYTSAPDITADLVSRYNAKHQ
jgi:outer membrane protein